MIMSNYASATVPTQTIEADGIRFSYRRLSEGTGVPVVLTNHFMGNLDTYDPAILDGLAATRDVITFDNAGVGSSTGEPKSTIADIAADAYTFIRALGLDRIDLIGHSMGGHVAQQVAFAHPELVRKLILIGTAPRGGAPGDPSDGAAGFFAQHPNLHDEFWLPIFFSASDASQAAGRRYLERIRARADRDVPFSDEAVATYSAARVDWATIAPDSFDYLREISAPALVVNGSHDIVIPTINSYTLQQNIPNAKLLLYPDSGHGVHFEYPEDFLREAINFLDRDFVVGY